VPKSPSFGWQASLGENGEAAKTAGDADACGEGRGKILG
jgi:hypothetical protein